MAAFLAFAYMWRALRCVLCLPACRWLAAGLSRTHKCGKSVL
ncbi:hypothetical protein HMPREF0972_00985 [Actinomyces sp. oral taxon 848 str. F0332]|nr:hypothetical protein HMPREF0972_00985 [Actinomyces sp. oral taxon 848 str. F0332]